MGMFDIRSWQKYCRLSYVILFFCLFLQLVGSSTLASEGRRSVGVVIDEGQGAKRQVELYRGSYALLVGVSDYLAGWPDLESVPAELGSLKNLFQRQGFKVETVLNPDSSHLEDAFKDFINRYGYDRENRLLFFFAGHGYTRQNGTKGYLVPVDAPLPEKDKKGFLRRALTMTDILAWSRKIEAKHALFLFDSCFSGSIFKERALPERPPHITSLTTKPVRQFITAGSAGETVPATSTFVPVLIDALEQSLADLNLDGYVCGTELGLFLQAEVPKHVSQNPQYGKISDYKLSRGDFIFVAGGSALYTTDATFQAVPETGSLVVVSRPSGAAVSVAGVSRGRAPVTLNDLSPGRLQVQTELFGYEPAVKTVLIRAGRQSNLTLLLDKIVTAGSLKISSNPAGAEWYLDGAYVGVTPDILKSIEKGSHKVLVRKPGYRDWTKTTTVYRRKEAVIVVDLEKIAVPVVAPPKVASASPVGSDFTEPVIGMEFVYVSGGCFQMGSNSGGSDEKPIHKVCVDGFWMGKYEVTQGQWQKVMGSNPSNFKKGDNYPVEGVSWDDCQRFIEKLNRRSDRTFRLPTEAEWEYAARSGGRDEKYAGANDVNAVAWYSSNSGRSAHAVGGKAANGLGLHDMSGNVYEWCADWYDKTYYKKSLVQNPQGPGSGSGRVGRGGCWYDLPRFVRSASRIWYGPSYRRNFLGFRLVSPGRR